MKLTISLNCECEPEEYAARVGALERVATRFLYMLADDSAASRHAQRAREAPAASPPAPSAPAADLAGGAAAIYQLIQLWWSGSFPLDHAVQLVTKKGADMVAYAETCGGLRPALDAILSMDTPRSVADVPTLLSMLSASGLVLPRGWYNEDYSDRPPNADGSPS